MLEVSNKQIVSSVKSMLYFFTKPQNVSVCLLI